MRETDLLALWLNRDDIARVAEFLECDVDAAFEFARKVWLPDARKTAARILSAILRRDCTSLLFLCDHLREGARSVGATRIMHFANDIETMARTHAGYRLTGKAYELKCALDTLGSLLLDRRSDAYAGSLE